MSDRVGSIAKKPDKITLQFLYEELVQLQERVDVLEDLRELNAAISRNKSKKLIPWATAKKQLGLDDHRD